jgi:pSer/pThr/pTyr-binding forkhead associated (FHA) protein
VADSSRVSRHHARIVVSDQEVIVEDMGSKNGTFVGDRRIDEPTSLADGDDLRFGDVRVVLRCLGIGGPDATVTM